MKKYIVLALLAFASTGVAHAATDYYLKLGGVDGETKASGSTAAPARATIQTTTVAPIEAEVEVEEERDDVDAGDDDTKASGDYFMKIDTIKGESSGTSTKKGNVEYGWKVEEGEKGAVPGVEPDEIDVANDGEPLTPDFGILLGGGQGDEQGEGEENRAEIANILLAGMEAQGAPAEQLSLNYEKIKTKMRQPLKLFGLIPVSVLATVEVDAEAKAEVSYPWWTFLASGKDGDTLGRRVVEAIAAVLETKSETLQDPIGDLR